DQQDFPTLQAPVELVRHFGQGLIQNPVEKNPPLQPQALLVGVVGQGDFILVAIVWHPTFLSARRPARLACGLCTGCCIARTGDGSGGFGRTSGASTPAAASARRPGTLHRASAPWS